jgi:XTP/dITP diphosphohydrolase
VIGRLVLASGNQGKLREFRRLLAPLAIDVVAQAELGIGEADEPYATFVENALAKARHASAASGLAALADDSGICVAALGGAPGVISAHYACVLVLVRRADDPEPVIAEGRWHGRVIDTPRGDGGFGYDPHFVDAASGLTGAEMALADKNAVSHRGVAMRALIERLRAEP